MAIYPNIRNMREDRDLSQKELAEVFIDGENAVPMSDIDQFEGHAGGAFHRILISTGGAETAVTAERNKL